MLLMGVCQNLLRQPEPNSTWNDLNSVQSGVQLLLQISTCSNSASFFSSQLDPLFRQAMQIAENYGAASHA